MQLHVYGFGEPRETKSPKRCPLRHMENVQNSKHSGITSMRHHKPSSHFVTVVSSQSLFGVYFKPRLPLLDNHWAFVSAHRCLYGQTRHQSSPVQYRGGGDGGQHEGIMAAVFRGSRSLRGKWHNYGVTMQGTFQFITFIFHPL